MYTLRLSVLSILVILLVGLFSGPDLQAKGKKKKKKHPPRAYCPTGTELLAKFEWKRRGYVFEKPEGNEGKVVLTGDETEVSWQSELPVELILLKGARDIDTLQVGGATHGAFNNHTLTTPSGKRADISNVQFCVRPSESGCQECKGKVTELTLQYTGSDTVYVKVKQKVRRRGKKKRKRYVTIFADTLAPNELFTLVGQDRKGTLGTEIRLFIEGQSRPVRIHTSCSQPIGPGVSFGDFLVVEAFSRKGGRICPQGVCAFDQGPPEVHFTMLDDAHIQVMVEDDVGLRAVDIGYSGGISLVASTLFTPGAPEAVFTFEIVDPGQDAVIQVVAWDLCGKAPCQEAVAPPVIHSIQVAPDRSYVEGTILDSLGVRNLEFFALVNAQVGGTDLVEGVQEVHFRIDKMDLTQRASFGLIVSNVCSAFILDPYFSSLPVLASRFRGDREDAFLDEKILPETFVFERNYPNPFREATVFRYTLPEEQRVELIIYDMLGRELSRLVSDVQAAGVHQVVFHAEDLPAGAYFYRFQVGDRVHVGQMVRVK